jgi:apolipoprotein N-acyltransferase
VSGRPRALVYGLALLTTPALHGLAFPPANLHSLAWIAFVPWFVAIRLAPAGTALLLTSTVTLLGSYLVTTWLPRAVAVYYGQPVTVGVALLIGVWAVTVAPWVLLFTLSYRALARRVAWTLPLLAGAAWAAAELGRVRLLVGDPFGLLGYSQTDVAPLVQIADVTGVYGVSFVVAAVNVGLAELGLAAITGRRVTAPLCGLALALTAVAAALGYGAVRLASSDLPRSQQPAVRVAVVQANLDLGTQWRQEFYGRNLEEYMTLTLQVMRDAHPALVVWPESALTFFLEDEHLYRAAIAHLLTPTATQLLTGGPRTDGEAKAKYYNSAFLVGADGTVVARYDKQQLLPFAEYFPFDSVGLLRRQFARVREFTAGAPTAPLPTPAGPAGVVICNEAMFGETVAERVRAGADYLVNLANDSWGGEPKYAVQAFDMARVRAVEQRRYLVRASTSGPSAIVDPMGRILASTAPVSRGVIVGTIRGNAVLTPYARLGDAFGILCAAAVSGALLLRPRG